MKGLERIFDDPRRIAREPAPVICLINTTDPSELVGPDAKPSELAKIKDLRRRAEALSGLPCIAVHYTQIGREDVDQPNVTAIIFTAWKALRDEVHKKEMYDLLRQTSTPLIAFCGGMHNLVLAYGGKVGGMRSLKPGEEDPAPEYYPGMFKEWGHGEIRILKRDPILEGIPDTTLMPQRHMGECQELPAEFENLARSAECEVQLIKHKEKLIYGTQFHPEIYDAQTPDGKTLLVNFFSLARKHTEARQRAFFAEVFGKPHADVVKAAYDALADARRTYNVSPPKGYDLHRQKEEMRLLEKADRGLDKVKAPAEAIASLKKRLAVARSICQWRGAILHIQGLTNSRAIVEALRRLAPPNLGTLDPAGVLEWEFVHNGGDLARDTKNIALSVPLGQKDTRCELTGWSDPVTSPAFESRPYRHVASTAKSAALRFQLSAGACLLQVTAFNRLGGPPCTCQIWLDGQRIGEFDGRSEAPEGWITRSYAIFVQPTPDQMHTLAFISASKERLPIASLTFRRLRLD